MISFIPFRNFLLELLLPTPFQDQWLTTPHASETLMRCIDGTPWAHRRVSCLSPLTYSHTYTQRAVHAMKYRGNKHAVRLLGTALAPFVAEELGERRLFGTYQEVLCIPLPLHASRLRGRGFNQAERLARTLVEELSDPHIYCDTSALLRVKSTESQVRQHTKKERVTNMRGAFYVPVPEKVRGKDILLLDDVITTGTTLFEAHNALRTAGARNVLCVAIAH